MKNLDYIEGFLDCKKQMLEVVKNWDMEFRLRCLKEIEEIIPYEESETEFFDMVKFTNQLLSTNVRPQSIS